MMARGLLFGLVLLLLPGGSRLFAQMGSEGAFLGVVHDSTGGVIPGADITLVNLDTGLTKSTTSDSAGNFEVLALPPGPYSISVSLQGFKTWWVERTVLTVGERRRLSPQLEVGELSEQVSVERTVELMQTDKSSVEVVVQERQLRELPLAGRNPVQLVKLAPGMRFLGQGNVERISTVQGHGVRDDQTEFQLDGLNANAGMDEGGMAIPNVDTIAEFNVQTSSFSAEHGRMPLQVVMVTKSGTNEFHGTGWEFLRDDKLDARNAFATSKPELRRNQFGFTVGGPVLQNRMFFFGSFEGTRERREAIYNSTVVQPEMLAGDFSSLPTSIVDPLTGQPFPNNRIPESRISSASRFFDPHILMPNTPEGRFRAVAPRPEDTYEYTSRVDYQLTGSQRIYGRWVAVDVTRQTPGYRPEVTEDRTILQHNVGVNYNYALSSTTLLTAGVGYLWSDNNWTAPLVGTENLVSQAGIQGIPSEGRETSIGLPNVDLTGYQGFSLPWGVPGRLWMWAGNAKIGMNLIRGAHSISFGYELNDRSTYAQHASHSGRGTFDFNGQYTGDAFADYLLGFVSSTRRNFPAAKFGMSHSPYSGTYIQDFWRIHPSVTLNLGLRFDYWHEKEAYRGQAATFVPELGKVVAGEDRNGQVDLGAQPVAPFLAEAIKDLWIPASEAGLPRALFKASGQFAPRLGLTWRPLRESDLVLRLGYGVFMSSYKGNHTASSGALPYRGIEEQTLSSTSPRSWEAVWPADPRDFVQPSITESPAWDNDLTKTHEWNLSVQQGLPFRSAITVSYVGARVLGQLVTSPYNEVPPGRYDDIAAARPWPAFGTLNILEDAGESWFNGLQVKLERRFGDGLAYNLSYSFSKHIADKAPASNWGVLTPFAPAGYERGRAQSDRTHILTFDSIYELPFGSGRRYMDSAHPLINGLLGGWQLTGIYQFTSGAPLTFFVPGATLGNGWDTRPNLVGNPSVSNPSAALWFDPAALEAPSPFQFGDSGVGILDGPGFHSLDLGFIKNFSVSGGRYLQFRWEMFNALNHVNLGNPDTTFGLSTTGQIFSSSAAREMQVGLKFIF
ncbi:MAG: TonB-dependent receptor plug domain-containing protein [Luteitalea sp.]|nr:TonB-dependent receptor plug domain-containing protein [Luteitalea sp.]